MRAHSFLNFHIDILIAVLLFSNIAYAHEVFSCNMETINFEKFNKYDLFSPWKIRDDAGNGIEWGTLDECGLPNYTGSDGNALCVKAQTNGPAFDTSIITNEFTLKGASWAAVFFRISYDDVPFQGDQVNVSISDDDGTSWTTLSAYFTDQGVNGGVQKVAFIPASFLGKSSLHLRFRYYDASFGNDWGDYVQIDDLAISCVGGADMQTAITSSKKTVVEGEELSFSFTFLNDGPEKANGVVVFGLIPTGFVLLDNQISQGLVLTDYKQFFMGHVGSLIPGAAATITTKVRAVTVPEVTLKLSSPAVIAGDYSAKGATFGPHIAPDNPINGLVVLADDNDGDDNDGCQPLVNTAEVAGNIVFMDDGHSCAYDEQVKNAQDAGAIAAIISLPNPLLPVVPGPLGFIEGLGSFEAMGASGNVTAPITIPSLLVDSITGTGIKTNIVNTVNATLGGLSFVSQERGNFGFTFADEFDPDINTKEMIYLLLDTEMDTDNIFTGSVTVLRDTDSDGTPDTEDACPNDASKITLGVCGCGLADLDTNGNGIIDCLSTEELKDKLTKVEAYIKKLKRLKLTSNVKKNKQRKKAQKELKKDLKELLTEMLSLVQTPVQAILLLSADTDLGKLAQAVYKKGSKATKTASPKLKANKKAARRAIKKMQGVLA